MFVLILSQRHQKLNKLVVIDSGVGKMSIHLLIGGLVQVLPSFGERQIADTGFLFL